jgi:hypothetical protein
MEEARQQLCRELAAAVKKLQGEHVLKKKSPESKSEDADTLCKVLEIVFLLDLKNEKGLLWRETRRPNMINPPQPSFWVFIEPMVSDEIKTQLMALRDSESDVMKCRSWLRIMLNKSLLLSFLEDLQRHPGLLSFHYGGESVLRDAERLEIVVQLLRGLSTIQLGYDYTVSSLTTWDSSVLQKAGIWQDSSSPNTRRDGERVSPPPASFGVGVVNMALSRYSRSSSLSQSAQVISREAASQHEEGGTPQDRNSAGGGRGNGGRGSADFSYAKSLDFEVVSEKTGSPPIHGTLTALLTKLVPERGLDSQNYCCAACRRPIGVSESSSYLQHLQILIYNIYKTVRRNVREI